MNFSFAQPRLRALSSFRVGLAGVGFALILAACNKPPETAAQGLPIAAGATNGTVATSAAASAAATAATAATAASKPELTPELMAARARGFVVGAAMSAHTVYVFFDPQCPHCGHLWEASQPLLTQVRFVWVPVAILGSTSAAQGATLLAAPKPELAMAEHEKSLLAGQGGITASPSLTAAVQDALVSNTQLFAEFDLESVPTVVAKHGRTGQTVVKSGALTPLALAEFLGVNLPQ